MEHSGGFDGAHHHGGHHHGGDFGGHHTRHVHHRQHGSARDAGAHPVRGAVPGPLDGGPADTVIRQRPARMPWWLPAVLAAGLLLVLLAR